MKKIYFKLIAMTLMFVMAVSVMLSASYAWFVISKSPVVNGIQVSISGGNTILIAADLKQTVDGVTYHYPDRFSDSLSFGRHESYDYLEGLGGLRPVSTADGINWFVATYYDAEDEAVLSGEAITGALRPVEDFYPDTELRYANLSAEDKEMLEQGHYICMDFWVVSPGSDYRLRVSTGSDGGSFVIDLLQPTQTDSSATGYTLTGSVSSTAASVRVGFLATSDQVTDNSLLYYQKSAGYDDRYTLLRGSYQEPGSTLADTGRYHFTIYEPNADAHPNGAAEDGAYRATYPVGLVDGKGAPVSVLDRTTVQLTSKWKAAENGGVLIEQIFQTALLGKHISGTDAAEFYGSYLSAQLAPYIDTGSFIRETLRLYDEVTPQILSGLEKANATDDVYIIELERDVPQRIRMFIWLEGQDIDWDPSNAASSFALNLELAGGTA